MTYSIATVVYGVDCSLLDQEPMRKVIEILGDGWRNLEKYGFTFMYSGGAHSTYNPCYFGVGLGDFDETQFVTVEEKDGKTVLDANGQTARLHPDRKDVAAYKKILQGLPDELRPLFEKPTVCFVWSTS